jgi:RasGEF N-terminal motif
MTLFRSQSVRALSLSLSLCLSVSLSVCFFLCLFLLLSREEECVLEASIVFVPLTSACACSTIDPSALSASVGSPALGRMALKNLPPPPAPPAAEVNDGSIVFAEPSSAGSTPEVKGGTLARLVEQLTHPKRFGMPTCGLPSLGSVSGVRMGKAMRRRRSSLFCCGAVKGVLVALITNWCFSRSLFPDRPPDLSYLSAFLLTYRSFTTSSELLSLLLQRYVTAEPESSQADNNQARPKGLPLIQLRVINVVKVSLVFCLAVCQEGVHEGGETLGSILRTLPGLACWITPLTHSDETTPPPLPADVD